MSTREGKSKTNKRTNKGISATKIATLSVFTALSLIMFLIENLFPPLFIPGAKMGLANIFSMAALILYGPIEAFLIIVVRTVLGAVFAGNVSMLMYSFTGGVVSMGVSSLLLYTLYPRISIYAVSVVAAVCHNVVQDLVFVAVYSSPVMFSYLPYLALCGILSGVIVGGVVMIIFKKIPMNLLEKVILKSGYYGKKPLTIKNKKNLKGYIRRLVLKAIKGKNFFAGIHIHDMKHLAKDMPIEVLPAPEEVAISLNESLGKPSEPCVAVGDHVVIGQLIAKAAGPISSNVYSSVCGEVTAIKEAKNAGGTAETHIVIKNDGSDQTAYMDPLSEITQDSLRERILQAGIVGLGGAGFPTAVKVAPRTPVDTLILNGAECEPYLTCDHRLMIEKTEDIVKGARYLAKAVGVEKIVIGIEANKPDAIAAFEKYDDIVVVTLKKQYPMGSEKHLIYVCTGRKVGCGKLPADAGVIVQNVATAYAVTEAVEQGKPLFERVLTVSGGAVKNPKNLIVKLGTPISYIIENCGGESEEPLKAVAGGPMTGVAMADYTSYTHKTTSGVLLLTKKEAAAEEPTPCLNCGKCADVCPMHLMPMNTAFYANAGDYELAGKLGGTMNCIECGACEYICPAKRPLIQSIRKTKQALRAKK